LIRPDSASSAAELIFSDKWIFAAGFYACGQA
jgi:hypothetical protein